MSGNEQHTPSLYQLMIHDSKTILTPNKTWTVCKEAACCAVDRASLQDNWEPLGHPDWNTHNFPLWITLEKNENPCPLTAGQWPQKTPHCPLEVSCVSIILPLSLPRPTEMTGGWNDCPAGPGCPSGSGQEGTRERRQLGQPAEARFIKHFIYIRQILCVPRAALAPQCVRTVQRSTDCSSWLRSAVWPGGGLPASKLPARKGTKEEAKDHLSPVDSDLGESWRRNTSCKAALPRALDKREVTWLLRDPPVVWPLHLMTLWGHRHLNMEARKDRQWPWLWYGDTAWTGLSWESRTARSCSFNSSNRTHGRYSDWESQWWEPRPDLHGCSSWLPISFVQSGQGQPQAINPGESCPVVLNWGWFWQCLELGEWCYGL